MSDAVAACFSGAIKPSRSLRLEQHGATISRHLLPLRFTCCNCCSTCECVGRMRLRTAWHSVVGGASNARSAGGNVVVRSAGHRATVRACSWMACQSLWTLTGPSTRAVKDDTVARGAEDASFPTLLTTRLSLVAQAA
eukprot:713159-Prymnesium_polylepis.1